MRGAGIRTFSRTPSRENESGYRIVTCDNASKKFMDEKSSRLAPAASSEVDPEGSYWIGP
jgi:hypothetical protein